MRYSYSEAKRRANFQKHGLDLNTAERIFDDYVLERADDREDYGEDRWQGLGLLDGREVVAVYVVHGDERIHFISLRRATSDERKDYWQARGG